MATRPEPIRIPPLTPPSNPAHGATIIFLHGLGDDGAGFANIAEQFQGAEKLPYASWMFPTAPENRDAMSTAWYTPTPLSPFAPQRPELEEDEDEQGMRASMAYVEGLIAECESAGVPAERVVLAGFSQGCVLSLFTSLLSTRYAGKLAGICGLCGYLPMPEHMPRLISDTFGEGARARPSKVFLGRGARDMLVPRRYHSIACREVAGLGLAEGDALTAREYEGMGHSLNGAVLRDVCAWLEEVIPPRK